MKQNYFYIDAVNENGQHIEAQFVEQTDIDLGVAVLSLLGYRTCNEYSLVNVVTTLVNNDNRYNYTSYDTYYSKGYDITIVVETCHEIRKQITIEVSKPIGFYYGAPNDAATQEFKTAHTCIY